MTISEIARLAGVSTSTVSRVFSHHPNIREDVRARVLAAAREHGYHPRLSSKQRNVVIVTPYDSVYPVQSCVDMILMALMRELPRRGFRLEVLPCNNLERLESIQFCGAVAVGAEPGDFKGWSERFPVPLVIVDRAAQPVSPDVCFVHSDERQGMTLAIDHLYRRGCRPDRLHHPRRSRHRQRRHPSRRDPVRAARTQTAGRGAADLFLRPRFRPLCRADRQTAAAAGRRAVLPRRKRRNRIVVRIVAVQPAASGGYFADRLRTDLLLAARGAAADHDQPGLSGHRRRHRRRVGKAAGRNAGSDRCRHAAVPADFARKRPGTVKIL